MLEFLSIILQTVIVVAIPFVASYGGEVLMHHIAHHEFSEVPILTTLARLQGLLAGGLLLHANLDDSYYDLEVLFIADSPWNLDLSHFLLERANLFAYDLLPTLKLLSGLPSVTAFLALLTFVLLPLLLGLICLRLWTLWDALRGLLSCLGTTLWSAWLTIYLVCLTFWGLHLLNFWVLALAALYIQYRRSRSHG
jgi:hypothetical protein